MTEQQGDPLCLTRPWFRANLVRRSVLATASPRLAREILEIASPHNRALPAIGGAS
ncbi:MAG: hypothetical protein V3U32_06785 [Anaerolineales bacterium]